MKLIIAGSRDINIESNELEKIISKYYNIEDITEIVCGMAKGVDISGYKWAKLKKIDVKEFKPDWSIGKVAGILRNKDMGDYADEAIVIYNGSKGSQHMIDYMKKINKPCKVVLVK